MTDIIISFLEARTTTEVTDLVIKNHLIMDKCPILWTIARNARRRITIIERVKRQNWLLTEQN